MFDVVEYLNPELEEQCRLDPTKAHLNYYPMLKEGDQVTIGCRAVLHAVLCQDSRMTKDESLNLLGTWPTAT
eukprot:5795563-Amphidinium_carterae.1